MAAYRACVFNNKDLNLRLDTRHLTTLLGLPSYPLRELASCSVFLQVLLQHEGQFAVRAEVTSTLRVTP